MYINKWICRRIAIILWCGALFSIAHAQSSPTAAGDEPEGDYKRVLMVSDTIEPLGDSPFGEQMDMATGGLSFTQMDIDLPGNGLQIQVVRTAALDRYERDEPRTGSFGDWELELPRITTLVGAQPPSSTSAPVTGGDWKPAARCSQIGQQPPPVYPKGSIYTVPVPLEPEQWWHGYQLVTPGDGEQQLLLRSSSNTLSPSFNASGLPSSFPIVTKNHWMVGCLGKTSNGQSGEAFFVISPSGNKYWLDRLVYESAPTYKAATIKAGSCGSPSACPNTTRYWLFRMKATMLVTRMEDRYGNWLSFTYNGSGKQLASITASDGRMVNFQWRSDAPLISQITVQPQSAAPRIWTYQYVNPVQTGYPLNATALTSAVRPDGRQWSFGINMASPPTVVDTEEEATDCTSQTFLSETENQVSTGTITHPSGLTGTFSFKFQRHGRSYVPPHCAGQTRRKYSLTPAVYLKSTLISKRISGNGVDFTWNYQYSQPNGSYSNECSTTSCATTTWTQIVAPDQSRSVYTFNNQWGPYEGKLLRVDVVDTGGSTLRTMTTTYASPTNGPYPSQLGTLFVTNMNAGQAAQLTPESAREIGQNGDLFDWQALAYDRYGNVTQMRRYNNIPGQAVIQEQMLYANDDPYFQSHWVLGKVKQIYSQNADKTVRANVYNPVDGTLQDRYAFGLKIASYRYNSQGLLASVTDDNNYTTSFPSYKLGAPQEIDFPDGTSEHVGVDDFGNVSSIADQRSSVTSYTYDALDRVKSISYPSSDTVSWASKNYNYDYLTSPELGISAGSLRARNVVGRIQTSVYYDARQQPVLMEEKDTGTGLSRYVRLAYDYAGRMTFESYPSSDSGTVAGMFMRYDALGRMSQLLDGNGTLLRSVYYLQGNQQQVVDASGNSTLTAYQAFDRPSYSQAIKISAPEGQTTDMARDVFGNLLSATQSGAGVSVTRSYFYDSYLRLCKENSPESGSQIRHYDPGSRVDWMAYVSLNADASCSDSGVSADEQIRLGYDPLGRRTSIDYPDDSGDVSFSYDQTGNLTAASNPTASWSYSWNKRNLLESETAVIDGKTFLFDQSYDNQGNLSALAYPDRSVSYSPDAWGEPTRVGGYASSIQYFPNGTPASYSFANGAVYSATLDNRLRPRSTTLSRGGLLQKLTYSYNDDSDIVQIDDGVDGIDSASLGYDGLHRLKVASGLWGYYEYTYDAVNNIRSRGGSSEATYSYDPYTNRLSGVGGSSSRSFAYDDRGRALTNGVKNFSWNKADQITSVSGVANYSYDANGNRIKSNLYNGSVEYSFYNVEGQLIYRYAPGSNIQTDYLFIGKTLIGEVMNGSVAFLHSDVLGSPKLSTNIDGAILWREHYDPYGEKLNGVPDKIGYTGYSYDAESGLFYAKARYYEAETGRFLSVDPVGFTENPFGFNRYSYGNNNPYLYTDPSGRCTGSNITNEDGTCKGSGGFTEDLSGDQQGNEFRQLASEGAGLYSQAYVRENPVSYVDPSDLGFKVGDWWDLPANLNRAREIAAEELAKRPLAHNDLGDAIRHSEWMRRTTEETNSFTAHLAGTGHEIEGLLRGQPMQEMLMDLHNNAVGRDAGNSGTPVPVNHLWTLPLNGSPYNPYGGAY